MTNEDKADIVIKEICRYYNTDFETLNQRRRWRRIVEPRQMIFYFLRQFTELSLAEIGKYFGYDHATVISACNTIDGLIRFNGYSNKTCVMAGRIDFEIKSFDIKKQDKYMEQWVLSMGTL